MKKLRWGILGTGNIARQFAAGVMESDRGELATVGSRSAGAANSFAAKFTIPHAHGSYDAMLASADVDAIYISLPNTMHHEWTIKALQAGKHVLCEKPIGVTLAEAQEMFDVANHCGKVLIEAFMYRAHPQTLKVMELVRSGVVGQVNLIRTSFCYRVRKTEGNIRFNAGLAGGALMDVGCYCLSFSRLVAGEEPTTLAAVSRTHQSGVDEQTSVIARFPGGAVAEFTVGMMTQADNTAYICGDEGYLRIPVPWKPVPGKGEIILAHSTPPRQDSPGTAPVVPQPVSYPIDDPRPLYAIEADAFSAAVLDSAAPFVSTAETLGNMAALETLRKQIFAR
ncbi:MAG: Gfo/Idh/MocA family oxidoreductase [Burkholderiales bacterium]|nr:Gfo/Idh/MocA family oxidoreductase [Phycisphaerae bacterium]